MVKNSDIEHQVGILVYLGSCHFEGKKAEMCSGLAAGLSEGYKIFIDVLYSNKKALKIFTSDAGEKGSFGKEIATYKAAAAKLGPVEEKVVREAIGYVQGLNNTLIDWVEELKAEAKLKGIDNG